MLVVMDAVLTTVFPDTKLMRINPDASARTNRGGVDQVTHQNAMDYDKARAKIRCCCMAIIVYFAFTCQISPVYLQFVLSYNNFAAIAMMRPVCTTMVEIECYCVAIEEYSISLVSCW
jgi:hypothetical protein